MSDTYTSSIVTRYGDVAQVKQDSKVIYEIIKRQGTNLLIDCIAEHVGACVLKFNLDINGRKNIRNSLIDDLRKAIKERV